MKCFKLTEDEYREMCDDYLGYCISCGAEGCELEPDARNYVCEQCGESQVFGTEELMMMGQIEIV